MSAYIPYIYEPHPVTAFPAGLQLVDDRFVDASLGRKEPVQVVRVSHRDRIASLRR